MIAIVPVRDGQMPSGGEEVIAEVRGRCILIGSGTSEVVVAATEVQRAEVGDYRPGAWSAALAPVVVGETLIALPGSPDGRDLAPRLAHALGRPLVSSAVRIGTDLITVARADGRAEQDVTVDQPVVVVLQVNLGTAGALDPESHRSVLLDLDVGDGADPVVTEVIPADPATIDLAEAGRIVAGGAGLGDAAHLEQLAAVGLAIGASLGATRVVTDAGWTDHSRQIGTTGVEVGPDLYLAFGISGAVQHIMGIGDPEHVISVNTDAACPMMARADLAIVSDAPGVVSALARHFEVAPEVPV